MSRLSNSWRLVKASAAVLASDKQLVVFPIVSGIAALIVTASFAAPLWLSGAFDRLNERGSRPLEIIVLFAFYLILGCVINYCNAALVGAALIRLRGGDPTVGDGFSIASQRARPILGYSVIGATVGVVLHLVKEKGAAGEVVAAIGGAAWGVATYLVLPVLVVEDVGPVEAVKRSGSLLKRTWGEQIVGNAGIGLAFGLVALAAAVVFAPLLWLAFAAGSLALMVPVIALAVVVALALAVLSSALKGIYTAALYRYAAEGTIGGGFDPDLIQDAFAPKEQRRAFGI